MLFFTTACQFFLRLCKFHVADGIFLSDFAWLFLLERKTKLQESHYFPTQFSTDLSGRSLSLLNDGLSKQMRNQNVCVVICGFSPLFACHYQLLSTHKVFIHTYAVRMLHMGEEHTHAHKHMRELSIEIGTQTHIQKHK